MSTELQSDNFPMLTERQRREREYFDEHVSRNPVREVNFESVEGKETRPWNPYWYVAQVVREFHSSPSQQLLDFGCGFGNYSAMFARVGYNTFGFDVSENNVTSARQLAKRYGFEKRSHFQVGTAEQLEYPSNFFDIIVGIDILHHVEIVASIKECYRVLKPGGIAVFKEPLEVPIFDSLRNSGFGTRIFSKKKSFERCITEDEKKLTDQDVAIIASIFPDLTIQRFRLFSRFDAFWRKLCVLGMQSNYHVAIFRMLEKFDVWCFKWLPFLKRYGGDVVFVMKK